MSEPFYVCSSIQISCHVYYRELAEHQISPHLGTVKLQKLRPEHMEQWPRLSWREALSARIIGHAHRLLSGALKRAVENGTLARNVAVIRKPPKIEESEIEILNADEIERVMAAS